MKTLLSLLLVLSNVVAYAQAPARIRGTITALEGDVLSVKSRDGRDLQIHLAPNFGVSTAKAATLAELKGTYVGATAINRDGRLIAVEVHALPPQAPPGHTPWDLPPGSTMTNATLEGIAEITGGEEMTMSYPGGWQKILVPPGTPVVTFVNGSRENLKVGEYVFTAARQEPDGKLTAQRVAVSKGGVRPRH